MGYCDMSGLIELHPLNLYIFAVMTKIASGLAGHHDRLIGSMISRPKIVGMLCCMGYSILIAAQCI